MQKSYAEMQISKMKIILEKSDMKNVKNIFGAKIFMGEAGSAFLTVSSSSF